jgi:parallel beta-helix repeat protein
LLVTAGFVGFITFESEVVSAVKTIYVGSGAGNQSTTINGGISQASDGDTVYVYSGTYYENVIVDKTINLTGEERDTTIINASGIEDAVHITADWVNITGFTAIGSGDEWGDAGIELDKVQNCRVFGNNASDSRYGIFLNLSDYNILADNIGTHHRGPTKGTGFYFWTSSNNILINNTFSYWGAGIDFWWSDYNLIIKNNFSYNSMNIKIGYSSNNTIVNNIIDNTRFGMGSAGIYISYCSYGYNTIIGNTIIDNTIFSKSYGIYVRYSSNGYNTIIGNTISSNRYGIYVRYSDYGYNTFVGNNIVSSWYGIYIGESSYNTFIGNTISSSLFHGVQIDSNGYNTLYHNIFTDNNGGGVQGEDYTGTNYWNDSYPSGGNYWSDWTTPDAKSGPNQDQMGPDGIVDVPYNLDGGASAKDYYPLTTPPPAVELPDLEVKNSDIIFDPSSPARNGTLVSISATIHNVGIGEAKDIIVRFYVGNPSEPGSYQIGSDKYLSSIGGGSSMNVEVQWTAGPIGIHDIYVVVDPDNTIIEMNEGNNIASKALEVIEIDNLPPTLYIKAVGEDVILYWDPPSNLEIDHYLIYRSTSQNDFNFSKAWVNTSTDNETGEPGPIPLRTMWNDTKAAFPDDNNSNYEEQYYYIIRAVNVLNGISTTSRTVGKWTKTFPQGVSTFSLPLEPIDILYTDNLTTGMNAEYIKYMNITTHIWMQHNFGDGNTNNTQMKLGEGYEVKFGSQTNYTFTGMPGAMILYDNVPFGFDAMPLTGNADSLTATVDGSGNVTLNWTQPANMGSGDRYYVLRSTSRDGFWDMAGVNYTQLSALPFDVLSYQDIGNATAGTEYYYMIVPVNLSTGEIGASSYSIGVWTAGYLDQYDTFALPLRLGSNQTADWFCDNIPDTVGINYYIYSQQRWCWHSTRMPAGAFDPTLIMTAGYQICTSNDTKFTFIGV